MADETRPARARHVGEPARHRVARQAEVDLIDRVTSGDNDAFAELFDSYGTRLYSLARRVCIDQRLAEDVVQETFRSVRCQRHRFDPSRDSLLTWLMTMVHRRSVAAVRRETRRRERAELAVHEDAVPHQVVRRATHADGLAHDESCEVRAALHTLSDEHRTVIALFYFAGRTQNEVASLTGLAPGMVKTRTSAALGELILDRQEDVRRTGA